jgi:hypothetical protein
MSSRFGSERQVSDQIGQSWPQQRLAAGHAQLHDTQLQEQASQPHQLRKCQTLAGFQEAILLVESLARHAIRAAKIAAIDHRQAQVAQWAGEGVAQQSLARHQRLRVEDGHGCQGYQIALAHLSVTSGTAWRHNLWRNRQVRAAIR